MTRVDSPSKLNCVLGGNIKIMRKLLLGLLLTCSMNLFAPVLPDVDQKAMQDRMLEIFEQERIQQERQQKFDEFLNHLGYKESRNNWKIYNRYGYIGEFQFGRAALKATGYGHVTFTDFKKDPSVFPPEDQRKAVRKLIDLNMRHIGNLLDRYEGKTINGIPVTKAGLIAATHLGGAKSVQIYFNSAGKINRADAFGTSIESYLQEFSVFII